MNEAHRIRTAFLASLSFHEETPEERTRRIELALNLPDAEASQRFSFEVAERLADAGTLERVDRFQRNGKAFIRYRHGASGETFLLPVVAATPEVSLARTHRPHWHARSRLLYRSLSRLIAVERKLFVRDERDLEYLQTDLGDILRTIVGSAREILECDEVRLHSLSRRPEEARYLQPMSGGEPWNRELAEEWVGRRMLPLYVEDLAEAGTVRAVVDAEAMDASVHVSVAPFTPAAPEGEFRSLAMARVGDPGTPFLYVLEAWSRTPRYFHDERMGILSVVAEHATDLLVTLKKLGMLVMIDELTGIYNRPYFSRQLDTEIARAYREERPMSLVIADIDDFKHVNDTYGYEAGNALLRELSQTLAGSVRPFDTVARWGGEEFALILSAETTKAEAREICERLRLKVQNMTLVVPSLDGKDNPVRVTMSIGGAMFPADVPVTWDRSRGLDRPQREKLAHDLWTRANMNLRSSKERGKNQVTYTGD